MWNHHLRLLITNLLCLCIFSPLAEAATLNPTEITIRDDAMKSEHAQILLLKKLVNINSGTTNIAGVYRTGKIVRAQLKQLGFKTKWIYEPAEMHKAPTLVAERKSKQGARLLLIGHLDTVFAPNATFKLFERKKETAKGPGSVDAKGGVVVMLYALKALQAAHQLDNTTITIVLTGDEEASGKPTSISRKPLFAAAQDSDIALDFEPGVSLETVTIARRGIEQWVITVKGNESHSASIFAKDVGDGAIFELARILNTMRTQLQNETSLSFNPGIVLGGTKIDFNNKTSNGTIFGKENVVAKAALAKGDLRFISEEQKQAIENKIRDIVKDNLPGTSATIYFENGIPAMQATEKSLKLLQDYSAVSEALGGKAIRPVDPVIRGAADISHIAAIVPANLSGLGPTGMGPHSIIETVDLSSLPLQTARTAILIYRLTR